MSDMPDKCPKCGSEALARSPFDYPSLGFCRVHFQCDSYGYTEEPFRLARRSDFCCEREERIKAERQRDQWRECAERLAEYAKDYHDEWSWSCLDSGEEAIAEFERLMEANR